MVASVRIPKLRSGDPEGATWSVFTSVYFLFSFRNEPLKLLEYTQTTISEIFHIASGKSALCSSFN